MDNRLKTSDRVTVEIYDEGTKIATFEGSGFHSVTVAINAAIENSPQADRSPEDYVYRVTDNTDGTSARYRINAGGNVKILPEE